MQCFACLTNLSRVMRKPAFCICKNKGADQLRCIRAGTLFSLSSFQSQNYKHLAIFCGYSVRFVLDLVGNPEDRFSHDLAHLGPLQ